MHERKKKDGERKDKKNERMRQDVAERKANASKEPHHTDQGDIQTHRAGSQGHITTQSKNGPGMGGQR